MAENCCRICAMSGNKQRSRSILLGLPTSIADASVATLGRGCHCPVLRYSGTVTLALVARTTSLMGKPTLRAHRQAATLPRLPDGTINLGARPARRHSARLVRA